MSERNPQTTERAPLAEAIEKAASVWSNAPLPSKATMNRAHRALIEFADSLPDATTIADLRKSLRYLGKR